AYVDGELAFRSALDVGRAPVVAAVHVRVLVVRRIAVGRGEHRSGSPLATHDLAFDRAGDVGRECHVVVLVGLVDDAVLTNPHEVDGQPEVVRGQVGESVGGCLVRHREDVPQVLDGQRLLGLGSLQVFDGGS